MIRLDNYKKKGKNSLTQDKVNFNSNALWSFYRAFKMKK
jgi:hypothetical protein